MAPIIKGANVEAQKIHASAQINSQPNAIPYREETQFGHAKVRHMRLYTCHAKQINNMSSYKLKWAQATQDARGLLEWVVVWMVIGRHEAH